jgi:predicted ribosomally synthesized peptide with nif11-like leader
MSSTDFEHFRERVLKDPSLQTELSAATDFAAFLPLVLKAGQRHGYDFTVADLEAAWRAAQRAWIERWL